MTSYDGIATGTNGEEYAHSDRLESYSEAWRWACEQSRGCGKVKIRVEVVE